MKSTVERIVANRYVRYDIDAAISESKVTQMANFRTGQLDTQEVNTKPDYEELRQKPSFAQVPNLVLSDALNPLTPEIDGDTKVFRLTAAVVVNMFPHTAHVESIAAFAR